MTTTQATDFLAKELFIKRSVVTFRSLSRELDIHVNEAKNELAAYYEATRDTSSPAVPTYLVSGDVPASTYHTRSNGHASTPDPDFDMDLEFEEDREDPDVVYESKVMLVDARVLQETMAQLSRVHSVHIYSLSPSRLGDAGLICAANIRVRNADVKGGIESFPIVGKITGSHVKMKAGAGRRIAASSSKTTLDAPVKVPPKAAPPAKSEQPPKSKTISSEMNEQTSAKVLLPKTESKDKLKPSGKLDWSKAKSKEKEPVVVKTKEAKVKVEPKPTMIISNEPTTSKKSGPAPKTLVSKPTHSAPARSEAQERGTKRKSRSLSDSEPESLSIKAKPAVASKSSNVKKEVVDSDDEEETDVRIPGRRRQKGKNNATSDSEMSLRAMMDIDDEQFARGTRVSKVRPETEDEDESQVEAEEEVTAPPGTSDGEDLEDEPIVPQKKRKQRKAVPVGSNGLKKRRVLKSRTTTDAKGYMQTEDYSSYESVEEEEEAAPLKPKGKKKVVEAKAEEPKPKAIAKEVAPSKAKVKTAPKPRGGASKRGGLHNFFGPDKGKK
ncbi:hypothetical protein PAXINDRAFT_170721 [Paxillus involutus ATCC 200175]|uniref:DNA polymerase delta subunit 3 n=1 Tax=Paxillus involutus ATCC 200175 TaxID=664439 RepID=A0A0C9SV52_PAXIN|nr:hypothetical protein PAXINDRAFT_170721 [Paxillus involutus ATCC 200175]